MNGFTNGNMKWQENQGVKVVKIDQSSRMEKNLSQQLILQVTTLILIQERKICPVRDCLATLIGYEVEKDTKFCHKCLRKKCVLQYHCGRCGNILRNSKGSRPRDWCEECTVKAQRERNFLNRYEKRLEFVLGQIREVKRKQFLDEVGDET